MTDDSTTISLPSTAQIQSRMLQDPHLKQVPVWDSLHYPISQLAGRTMRTTDVYQEIDKAIVGLIHDLEGHLSEDLRERRPEWLAQISVALIDVLIRDHVMRLEAADSLSQHLTKLGFGRESSAFADRVLIGIF